MEEFCLYQWIFTYDTFDKNYINSLAQANSKTNFTPFILEYIKNSLKIDDSGEKIKKFDEIDKRELIINIQKVFII